MSTVREREFESREVLMTSGSIGAPSATGK
jgi:hypothetical protein